MTREVWITGSGLISALGEGREAHWAALNDPAAWHARMDSQKLAPYTIHPMVSLELGRHIPRPGDQRAMGPLMHYGCYAAGMALAEAGIRFRTLPFPSEETRELMLVHARRLGLEPPMRA